MAEIRLQDVTKVYPDGTRAVSSVDLDIPDGKLVVLVGPSGCGKTTLLRMVAGLETITEGTILIGDQVVNDIPPKRRDVAMVFQNYALYPHMTVYDNMAFSLKLHHVKKSHIDRRVHEAATILGLRDQLAKKPRNLSGGQRQRVAMGRAIVREPKTFLMDEPLSNLDAKLRVQMRAEIARIQHELGVTTIYVTHDQLEALTLGDLVAVMRHGVIQQVAEPNVLFERPRNVFVAGFIGSPSMNLVEARLIAVDGAPFVEFGGTRLRASNRLPVDSDVFRRLHGRTIVLGIRPEDMYDAALLADPPDDVCFDAVVELRESMGREAYVHFTVDAPPVFTEDTTELAAETDSAALEDLEQQASARVSRFVARVSGRTEATEGRTIRLAVDTSALLFFELETGEAVYASAQPPGRESAAVGASTWMGSERGEG
jgi:multiple sugar transport system ATP-binding protein